MADAHAKYDRMAVALESATAALTADARETIEEGPLAAARKERDDALRAAERRFDSAVREAVEVYGSPAVTVFSAAVDTMTALRTDYEVFAAVVEAADAALASEIEDSRAAQVGGQGAEAELKAAAAAVADARRTLEASAAERAAARSARPADPKPDYASNFLGGLAAGLSEAAGDYEKARVIRGELNRETSSRLGEHAASVRRYESGLAAAEEAVVIADNALGAAIRRFDLASTRFRSAREAGLAADSDYHAAYEARIEAGIDAARITRVHGVDELEAVTESLREGALSAIAQIEEATLATLTRAETMEVFQSAVAEYAEPRATAVETALEEIETDYLDSLEVAESEYAETVARASAAVDEFNQALVRHDSQYQRTVRVADKGLEDALVRFYGISSENQFKGRAARDKAESTHRNALEAAVTDRGRVIAQDVPTIRPTLAQVEAQCYGAPNEGVYGLAWSSAQTVVRAMRTYKANRERADAELGNCVADAHMQSAAKSGRAALEASQERARSARESARSVAIARVIGSDRDQAGRLRTLEVAVLTGLLIAAQAK